MNEEPRARGEIDLAVRILVGLLQRHVPGLVTGFHLVGSAVLGDFRPGRSDLDFVAVLSGPVTDADIEALVILHRLYASDPTLAPLDGIWVTEAELAAGPDAAPDGLTTLRSQMLQRARGNRSPVTWVMLHENSLAVLGTLDRSRLWHDPVRLSSWVRGNVEDEWSRWLARSSGLLSLSGLSLLGDAATERRVLGISRLHYALATGKIVSKLETGRHALASFDPRWQRLIEEAMRIRRGESGARYGNRLARRRDVLAYVAMVIGEIERAH